MDQDELLERAGLSAERLKKIAEGGSFDPRAVMPTGATLQAALKGELDLRKDGDDLEGDDDEDDDIDGDMDDEEAAMDYAFGGGSLKASSSRGKGKSSSFDDDDDFGSFNPSRKGGAYKGADGGILDDDFGGSSFGSKASKVRQSAHKQHRRSWDHSIKQF